MQAPLDGARWDRELRGQVADREVMEMVEYEQLSLVGRQPVEGGVHGRYISDRIGCIRQRGVMIIEHDLACASPPAEDIAASVSDDSVEPGVESIDIAKLRQLSPGRDEAVLDHVTRISLVVEHGAGRPKCPIQSRFHELGEGISVTPGGPGYQV